MKSIDEQRQFLDDVCVVGLRSSYEQIYKEMIYGQFDDDVVIDYLKYLEKDIRGNYPRSVQRLIKDGCNDNILKITNCEFLYTGLVLVGHNKEKLYRYLIRKFRQYITYDIKSHNEKLNKLSGFVLKFSRKRPETIYIPDNLFDFNRISYSKHNLDRLKNNFFNCYMFVTETFIDSYLTWLVDGIYRRRHPSFYFHHITYLGNQINASNVYNEKQKKARIELVERYSNKLTLLGCGKR